MSESLKRKAPDDPGNDSEAKKAMWALGLLKAMKDPKYIVKTDKKITMIKDMYPKAKCHFLILPKEDIGDLKALNRQHLDLLKHMENVARKYVKKNHKNVTFKFGFHAEASMHRLHMHIISDDMDAPTLKSKKHWNSFMTKFFLSSDKVISSLEELGRVRLPSAEECREYLNKPLKCHKCDFEAKNMPNLKRHIVTH